MANPYRFYFLACIFLSVSVGIALWYFTGIGPVWIYLITLSFVTFLFYGYDKHQAVRHGGRIPEAVLNGLALAGGTPGALAGQVVFRHKTRKLSFRAVFIMIAVVQTGLIVWWFMRERA
ncbi:MAG TPA: DUF1294 domain-containing protein [Anaerohalosphaeraceae bacterium]|nr:DUF1294 domain-containing protein [Anaerohalosphaeraceae bacterium]